MSIYASPYLSLCGDKLQKHIHESTCRKALAIHDIERRLGEGNLQSALRALVAMQQKGSPAPEHVLRHAFETAYLSASRLSPGNDSADAVPLLFRVAGDQRYRAPDVVTRTLLSAWCTRVQADLSPSSTTPATPVSFAEVGAVLGALQGLQFSPPLGALLTICQWLSLRGPDAGFQKGAKILQVRVQGPKILHVRGGA